MFARLALGARLTLFTGFALFACFTRLALFAGLFTLLLALFALLRAIRRYVTVAVVGIFLDAVVFAVLARAIVATRLASFVLPLLLVREDAEIVIGELEVVFLGHAIAVEMRIMRQLAVLLEQLRGIAPRTAIDPVDLLAALRAIVTAAAPTVIVAVATIVIQGFVFLKTPDIARASRAGMPYVE